MLAELLTKPCAPHPLPRLSWRLLRIGRLACRSAFGLQSLPECCKLWGPMYTASNAEGRDKLGWSSNLPLFSIRCIVQSTRKIALPLFHRNLASVISHCDTNAWHAWCLTSAAKKGFCLLNRSVAPQQPSRSPNACKDKHWLNSPQNCPIGPRHDPPMLCKHPGIVASIGIPVMHWIHACCPKPSLHRGGVSKIGII